MKLLVQRVSKASVEVEEEVIGSIGQGVLVFVGFDKEDNLETLNSLSEKLLNYKIFNDSNHKVALSLIETNNDILIVPQVTLSVGTKKGTKPSFSHAADPETGHGCLQTLRNFWKASLKELNRESLERRCQ